jgi:hypothetical protein
MAIEFKYSKSEAARKDVQSVDNDGQPKAKADITRGLGSALADRPQSRAVVGTQALSSDTSFVVSGMHGIKVKMPDSVHVFLPGEVIEFIERPLDKDGVKKELERRERRKALKIKATVAWKKARKEKEEKVR